MTPNLPTTEERLDALLRNIGDLGRCKGCGASIMWVVHRNLKRVPYTLAGLNHFIDCPRAKDFKK